jgi:DNA-binding CsgD family transcriptional regulator
MDQVEVSRREAEVLAALGEQLSNADVAAKLYISVRTVESHVSSLLRKFGVTDRRALIERATANARPCWAGWTPPNRGPRPRSATSTSAAAWTRCSPATSGRR